MRGRYTHTSLPSTNITILYHNWQKNRRNPNIFTLQRTTDTLTLLTISIPCTICISHSEIDYKKLGNGTNSRLRRNLGTDLKSREEWLLLAIKKGRSPILQFDHLCRVCARFHAQHMSVLYRYINSEKSHGINNLTVNNTINRFKFNAFIFLFCDLQMAQIPHVCWNSTY